MTAETDPLYVPDEKITAKQAADILGVHTNTVWNWCEAGYLPHTRLPSGHRRLRRSAVLELARDIQNGIAPKPPSGGAA